MIIRRGRLSSRAAAAMVVVLVTTVGNVQAKVIIEVKDGYRVFRSDGIPDHEPGIFPNAANPNRILPQQHVFRVPLKPKISETTTSQPLGPFGIALNGVTFEGGANEWWNHDRRSGWQVDAMSGAINLGLDDHFAHVQPTGNYHYHGLPTGLIKLLTKKNQPTLLGYAGDGFPIYDNMGYIDPKNAASGIKKLRSGYRVRSGRRPEGPHGRYDGTYVQDYEHVPGAGDLDECNGRFGVTPEHASGTYYYVLTDTFPYVPRAFHGVPDESFLRRPGPPPHMRGGIASPRGRRPRGFRDEQFDLLGLGAEGHEHRHAPGGGVRRGRGHPPPPPP